MKLTKKDIQTMKQADEVCFRKDCIELVKKHSGSHFEDRHSISVEHNLMENDKAFVWLTDNSLFKSIFAFLKEGDEVQLYWYADAFTNQYLVKHGLHSDVLYLKIWRESKNGKKKLYKFLVDVITCEDNSARMIKEAKYTINS